MREIDIIYNEFISRVKHVLSKLINKNDWHSESIIKDSYVKYEIGDAIFNVASNPDNYSSMEFSSSKDSLFYIIYDEHDSDIVKICIRTSIRRDIKYFVSLDAIHSKKNDKTDTWLSVLVLSDTGFNANISIEDEETVSLIKSLIKSSLVNDLINKLVINSLCL